MRTLTYPFQSNVTLRLKNLSTIKLLFHVSRGIEIHRTRKKSIKSMNCVLVHPWNEVKDAAISHLQGSSADGPKS